MPSEPQDHMISLEQISIGYKRNLPLLSGLNLTAEPGEMIALVGRNGTGKSTLLRSILGLTPLLAGKCLLRGIALQDYDLQNRARTVSYVSSQVARIPSITVRELVSLGRIPYTGWMGRQGKEDRKLVEKAIMEVGMEKYMDRNLEQLSDGERQRVMIARAFVQDTPVMVLDEPAAYLDIPNKYELVRILSAFRDQRKTILYSTHDLETAMMCADKFWVILDGQIHEGSPEDLGLSGLFEQLFESSGIAFDRESGRFKYQLTPRGGIGLVDGPDQAVVWTRHTLERLGFEVSESEEQTTVKVTRAGSGYHWIVKQGNAEKTVGSLYRLARFLTQDD